MAAEQVVTPERTADNPDAPRDALLSDLIALGGAGLAVTTFGAGDGDRTALGPGAVRLGVHRGGPLPADGLGDFDILLSADIAAPRPWVGL
ncbi:MAG TPA: hypothetical protein VF459_20040, partial [Caulobacteraceae bacterium]